MRELHLATKLRVRVVGRLASMSRGDILTVIDGISDPEDFAGICRAYASTGAKLPTDADGEGRPILDFFKWLLEWLASPEGQNFIKFILSLFGFMI